MQSKTKNKVTINDVAKKAGCSVTTVSLALNGKGRISDKTIRAINKAIKELGFIKNRNAASLREHESNLIGMVTDAMSNEFYDAMINEMDHQLFKQNKISFFCKINDQNEIFKKVSLIIGMGCDGVILCLSDPFLTDVIQILENNSIPFIVISQASDLNNIPLVLSDSYLICKEITTKMIQLGHQKIVYLGGDDDSLLRAERLQGYIEALIEFGLPFNPDSILSNQQLQNDEAFKLFLSNHASTSSFLCHDKKTAVLLYTMASKMGRNLKYTKLDNYFESRIEIVGFDSYSDSCMECFEIKWVNASIKKLCQETIELLQSIIHQSNLNTKIIITDSDFSEYYYQ